MPGLGMIDTGDGEQCQKYVPGKDVTIALFFDGTKNNKYNITERKIATGKEKEVSFSEKQEAFPKGTVEEKQKADAAYQKTQDATPDNNSYDNDYSNIALLYDNFTEDKYVFKIYIEGEGTEWFKEDDQQGYAIGSGATGIPARVKKACQLIIDKINPILSASRIVQTLIIDIFGFSRGAAAARHFVHEITKERYDSKKSSINGDAHFKTSNWVLLTDDMGNDTEFKTFPYGGYLGAYCEKQKITINIPIIRFVGLFDTVASYNNTLIDLSLLPNGNDTNSAFKKNTKELHLDAVSMARQVVHFTADDEHRANFPLTSVPNDGEKKSFSYSLPGVHSDIGGGYPDEFQEIVDKIFVGWESQGIEEKEKIIKQAWYDTLCTTDKLDIIPIKSPMLDWKSHFSDEKYVSLRGERLILNTYSFIPLHFMAKKAIDYTIKCGIGTQIAFDQKTLETEKSISNDKNVKILTDIKSRLEKQVFHNEKPLKFEINDKSNFYDLDDDQKILRQLRRKYLHWNSHYVPVSDGLIGSLVTPMYPRIIDGKRLRLVLPIPADDNSTIKDDDSLIAASAQKNEA